MIAHGVSALRSLARPTLAMGYGLYVISLVTGLSCHHRLANIRCVASPVGPDTSPQNLTPASGRQAYTISPSAPVPPKHSPDLVPVKASFVEDSFKRRSSARRIIAHGVESALAIPCAPDAVASIASHRAFVTCATPLVG